MLEDLKLEKRLADDDLVAVVQRLTGARKQTATANDEGAIGRAQGCDKVLHAAARGGARLWLRGRPSRGQRRGRCRRRRPSDRCATRPRRAGTPCRPSARGG